MRASLQIPFARRWHADASATLQLATRNDGDGARHSELAGGVIGAGVGYDLVRHARLRLRWRIMGQTPPLLADGVDDYATAATDFLAARGAFGAASHLSLHLTRQRTWWQLDLGGGVARRRGRVDNAAAYAFAGVGFGARVGPAWFIEANASIAMNEARGGLVVGAMVKRRLGSGALCAGPLLGVVVPTTAFAGLALSRC